MITGKLQRCQRTFSLLRRGLATTAQPQLRASQTGPILARLQDLVASQQLQRDEGQVRIARALDELFADLQVHTQALSAHREELDKYMAAREVRLRELEARDAAKEAAAAAANSSNSSSSSSQGWMDWLMGGGIGVGGRASLTPEQRVKLAVAEREAAVSKELGPPPAPPPAPKGLYIYGGVGSGKTLLMDLFASEVARAGVATHHRRAHFNAAMVEIHSRMHALDVRAREEAAALAASGPGGEQWQDGEYDAEDIEGAEEPDHSHSHQCQGQGQGAVQSPAKRDRDASTPRTGIFRYWDEGVMRQRNAKRAVLAIRRHLRQAQLGRNKPEVLAASNSASVTAATLGFARTLPWGPHLTPPEVDTRQSCVVCLDEMQVSDPFSAVVLKGLVEYGLDAAGGVLVCTSNRAPHQLPRHGLHEVMFDHFVGTLHSRCRVVALDAGDVDYRERLLAASGPARDVPAYTWPLSPATHATMDAAWAQLCAGVPPQERGPATIQVAFGRTLTIEDVAGGAARVPFSQLCATTTGPTDFMALASSFHTIMVTGVPAMTLQVRDQARRFITLLDELYNARVRLLVSADAPPHQLFGSVADREESLVDLEQLQFEGAVEGSKLRRDLMADGSVAPVLNTAGEAKEAMARLGGMEERFAFARAVSRLEEMRSHHYLAAWAARHGADALSPSSQSESEGEEANDWGSARGVLVTPHRKVGRVC